MSNSLKINTIQQIDVDDWDTFVQEVYGKLYNYQQQDGCRERGIVHFEVPCSYPEDFEDSEIVFKRDTRVQGVSFKTWLETNPDEIDKSFDSEWESEMFWDRHFYPSFDMVCNDLYDKGLLAPGRYQINIDW